MTTPINGFFFWQQKQLRTFCTTQTKTVNESSLRKKTVFTCEGINVKNIHGALSKEKKNLKKLIGKYKRNLEKR